MTDAGVCSCCGEQRDESAAVRVAVVWTEMLGDGYPLLPSEHYSICMNEGCDSLRRFIGRAMDAHPLVRSAGPCVRAWVVYADGAGSLWQPDDVPEMARA